MIVAGKLAGVFQSYCIGKHKNTERFPTKSAVAGIVLQCLGLDRFQANDHVAEFNRLKFHVRVDAWGIVHTDFHTVNGPLLNADGKPKLNAVRQPETLVFENMESLNDAVFTFFLEGDDEDYLNKVAAAIQWPASIPYLGRSGYAPSQPIFHSIHNDLHAAVADTPVNLMSNLPYPEDLMFDFYKEDTSGKWRDDVLLSLMPHRLGGRFVRHEHVLACISSKNMPEYIREKTKRKTPDSVKLERRVKDNHRCAYCQLPDLRSRGDSFLQYHHLTYVNYGRELPDDGITLCVICHQACTSLNHENPVWWGHFDPRTLKGEQLKIYEEVRESRLEYFLAHKRVAK